MATRKPGSGDRVDPDPAYVGACAIARNARLNQHVIGLDFEIELITRDKINVSYIIALLRNLANKQPAEQAKARKAISDALDSEAQLRSKKELIERFIEQHFAALTPTKDVGEAFDAYWAERKREAIETLSEEEGLRQDALESVIGAYLFTEKTPMRDEVIGIMEKRPSLRERRSVADRVISKIKEFVSTYIDGID